MITNNETPHVIQTVRAYLHEGGPLQWVAQICPRPYRSMEDAIDDAVAIGASAGFVHGGYTDKLFDNCDSETLTRWVEHARSVGLPIGVAGHSPAAHDWVDSLDLVDFHGVCFFRCGSVHNGQGERFSLSDAVAAAACCRRINKPCIGYKIMGAGRIDARSMAFEARIRKHQASSGDVVNVGMHRGDKDGMVEENADLVLDSRGGGVEPCRALG